MWCDDEQGRACSLASAEGGAGEVVWGEVIAGAADGFDASVFGAPIHQEMVKYLP